MSWRRSRSVASFLTSSSAVRWHRGGPAVVLWSLRFRSRLLVEGSGDSSLESEWNTIPENISRKICPFRNKLKLYASTIWNDAISSGSGTIQLINTENYLLGIHWNSPLEWVKPRIKTTGFRNKRINRLLRFFFAINRSTIISSMNKLTRLWNPIQNHFIHIRCI